MAGVVRTVDRGVAVDLVAALPEGRVVRHAADQRRPHLHMSQGDQSPKTHRVDLQPPFISAADVHPANYPRAHFDKGIALAVKETARRRAPTRSSVWDHRVGFAGELGGAAYCDTRADWTITDDYEGDGGYDFIYNGSPTEVKTTTSEADGELRVPVDKVDTADYYILAQCSRPDELVHLIGWTTWPRLKAFGHRFDGALRLEPKHLFPFEPLELFPDRIRDSQGL